MLDRKNYESAIPQLEKKIGEIESGQKESGINYDAFRKKTEKELKVVRSGIVDNNALIIEERERAIGVEGIKADADSVYDKLTTDSMVDEASTMATDFIAPSTVGQTADDCIKVFPKAEKSNPQNYVQIDSDSVDIVKGGQTVAEYSQGLTVWSDNGTEIAHLGYGPAQGESGPTTSPYYDLGVRKSGTTKGAYSVAEGYNTTASGYSSHAEGNSTASGHRSHAEGYGTRASGDCSHAEGIGTTAIDDGSHAEGWFTTASGGFSHAEGRYTTASGDASHAQGKYNVVNSNHADIVGNGTSDSNRSNAYALDWNGNGYYKGDVYVGCNADSSGGFRIPQTQTGTYTFSTISSNTYEDYDVTFPIAFSSSPSVICGFRVGSSTSMYYANATVVPAGVSATGFTIRVFNGSSGGIAPTVGWIASL